MNDQVKKICSIWLTESTFKKYFPQENVVSDIEEIQCVEKNSLFLKYMEGIDVRKYEVYAKDENVYKEYVSKLNFKGFYYR